MNCAIRGMSVCVTHLCSLTVACECVQQHTALRGCMGWDGGRWGLDPRDEPGPSRALADFSTQQVSRDHVGTQKRGTEDTGWDIGRIPRDQFLPKYGQAFPVWESAHSPFTHSVWGCASLPKSCCPLEPQPALYVNWALAPALPTAGTQKQSVPGTTWSWDASMARSHRWNVRCQVEWPHAT